MKKLTKQDRYYLESIKRMLEADFNAIECGPSLYSEILGDNIEWLTDILDRK